MRVNRVVSLVNDDICPFPITEEYEPIDSNLLLSTFNAILYFDQLTLTFSSL